MHEHVSESRNVMFLHAGVCVCVWLCVKETPESVNRSLDCLATTIHNQALIKVQYQSCVRVSGHQMAVFHYILCSPVCVCIYISVCRCI